MYKTKFIVRSIYFSK